VKAVRQRMRARGWAPVEVWLSPKHQALLAELRHFSEPASETVARALEALSAATARPEARPAQLRRRVRALRDEGLSANAIAKRLQQEGAPTLSGRGTWRHAQVLELLAEPAGEVTP
jgi:hypothetical protein